MEAEELMGYARQAMGLSYSPYSKFPVGAAILCSDGSIYQGMNVENASYPLTMCAERCAIYAAMADGKTQEDFVALAIIADTEEVVSPCGACRQVLSELFPGDAPIYLGNLKGEIESTNIEELLPFAFGGDDL